MADRRHEGRVAVITGASRGIGREVAVRLGSEGARVVVAAKSDKPGGKLAGTIHDTVEAVEAAGGEALAMKVDVRDENAVRDMIDGAVDHFGKLDIVFNNAGAIYLGPVETITPKQFDLMLSVNVRAAFLTAHFAIPHLKKNGWGHILNFSPALQEGPSVGMAPYMLTKYGMTRLAISMALEHKSDNIAANALWPVTMIETAAVINNNLGDRSQWRTPEIICDAVSELFSRDPQSCTGRQLTDEDVLTEAGVTDFDKYWSLGTPPDEVVTIAGAESIMK